MLFPKWANKVTPILLLNALGALASIIFVFWYWFSPSNLEVGYAPKQPIDYSHKVHVGELGIDCRYCHYTVEEASYAAIPSTETCMNCHKLVKTESTEVKKIQASYENNQPIEWVKVHMLPDYTYFSHSPHISAGVSCVDCHGRVDEMEVVYQAKPLSMSWCIDCHNDPTGRIRPTEFVTDLAWEAGNGSLEDKIKVSKDLIMKKDIYPRQDCNTCHR